MKFHYNALNTQSFLPKRIRNLLKENMFHFLPLHVTRSNCKHLVHNQDFCFHRSQNFCTESLQKTSLTLVGAARNKWKTDWMESNIYSKPHQPDHHGFHFFNTHPSECSAGALNFAPHCDAKCISSITSNWYCTACIHTVQGLRGLGRDGYSSHHLLVTARCSPHSCLQNS